MPELMDCLQIEEWGGDLALARRPVPDVGVTDVLVEVHAASVGRTVWNAINGDLGTDPEHLPRIPGHEVVGEVVARGDGVTSVEEGDLVASYTYLVCDHCDACLRGDHPLCENLQGFLGVDADGGFAEYARLPARNVIELPDGIDPVAATVVPDAMATPYHVMNQRAGTRPGDDVMVLGAGGGVGIHLVQVAQYFGCDVTAVDLNGRKLSTCRDLGATHTIDTSTQSLTEGTAERGGTYDAIVDFTGSMDLLEEATSLLSPRGRLVNLTTFRDRSFDVSPREQVFAESEIVGSLSFSKNELRKGAELLADGEVQPVISSTTDFSGVESLLSKIGSDELTGRGALVL